MEGKGLRAATSIYREVNVPRRPGSKLPARNRAAAETAQAHAVVMRRFLFAQSDA